MPRHSGSQPAVPPSRPAWINPSTVIGAPVVVIGLLIFVVLVNGIRSMNNRFEGWNAAIESGFDDPSAAVGAEFDEDTWSAVIDERFDAQDAVIDVRFAAVDERFDAIEARLDVIESEIKGLRQDVNDINLRLDLLIGVLEAAEVIPDDVVPKSSTEALAAVGGS